MIFTWTPNRKLGEEKASSHCLHTKLGLINSWGWPKCTVSDYEQTIAANKQMPPFIFELYTV
jgi:hypothetical protein